jgi:hypothetical protein
MLLILLIAGPCYAEDPLETLNTVEDTLNTMERTLDAQAAGQDEGAVDRDLTEPDAGARQKEPPAKERYFVSDEPLGARGWVAARPCPKESRAFKGVQGPESCADAAGDAGGYFWESRSALAADLRPGTLVVATQAKKGSWFIARVTDLTELRNGYVGVSAPFKAPVQGLRIIEE